MIKSSAKTATALSHCAVIGHRRSGKTALIGALLHLTPQSIHSFHDEHPAFAPTVVPPQSAGRTPAEVSKASVEDIGAQVVASLRNGGQYSPTSPSRVFAYDITLTYLDQTVRKRRVPSLPGLPGQEDGQGTPRTRSFRVMDTAGELLFPDTAHGGSHAGSGDGSQRRAAELSLFGARSVVLCLPVTYFEDKGGATGLQYIKFLERLRAPDCGLETLVICLTKYESRWAAFGREAVQAALDPAEFLAAAHEIICDDDGLRRSLIGLAGKRGAGGKPVNIVVCPVSVYGFINKNGCANYDLHHDSMLIQSRIDPRDADARPFPLYGEEEARRYWQPFLIADPFMYLATGRMGRMTYPLDEIL